MRGMRRVTLLIVIGVVAAAGVVIGVSAYAAGFGSQPPSSHGGPVRDYVSLVDNLRAAGATVNPTGAVSQPFMATAGQGITVDGKPVQAYEYADETAARAELARFSADAGTVKDANGGISQVDWVAPPHFFQKGRVIALYVGTDQRILDLLRGAMGPQVKGR